MSVAGLDAVLGAQEAAERFRLRGRLDDHEWSGHLLLGLSRCSRPSPRAPPATNPHPRLRRRRRPGSGLTLARSRRTDETATLDALHDSLYFELRETLENSHGVEAGPGRQAVDVVRLASRHPAEDRVAAELVRLPVLLTDREAPAELLDDVLGGFDERRAITNQRMPAAISSAGHRAGHHHDFPPLVEGTAGRDERARLFGRLDDDRRA